MYRDGKAKYFLDVKQAWCGVEKTYPTTAAAFLSVAVCWGGRWAGELMPGALREIGKELPVRFPSTAQPAYFVLRDWERKHSSQLSADPGIGVHRITTFDKAFNGFECKYQSYSLTFDKVLYQDVPVCGLWTRCGLQDNSVTERHLVLLSRSLSWPKSVLLKFREVILLSASFPPLRILNATTGSS